MIVWIIDFRNTFNCSPLLMKAEFTGRAIIGHHLFMTKILADGFCLFMVAVFHRIMNQHVTK